MLLSRSLPLKNISFYSRLSTFTPHHPSPLLHKRLFSISSILKMPSKSYKAIVIGSGQGGTPLVSALAAAGHKTALIESTHIGGTCINEGCTPTKTMVASAKVAYYARRQADFGVKSSKGGEGVEVDMTIVRKRKRDIVESFRGGSEGRLERAENVTVVRGKARFVGEREVEVQLNKGGEERLKAEWVFINVGCRPAPLGIEGEEEVEILDSTSVMELGVVPEHLAVVGGGYVGLEFAQMFKRFGSRVTVVQRSGKLLGRWVGGFRLSNLALARSSRRHPFSQDTKSGLAFADENHADFEIITERTTT